MRRYLLVLLLVTSFLTSGCSILDWKAKSGLQVVTNDVRSSVFLDGVLLDTTPYINKEIKPGEYLLQIQPDDPEYVPYSTRISLYNGFLTVIAWKPGKTPETSGGVTYEAEPLPNGNNTKLTLISIPDTAIVQIDSAQRGFTPLSLEDLLPEHHDYQVALPSYETQKHTIDLIKGYHTRITVKLAKEEDLNSLETQSTLGSDQKSPSPSLKKLKILKTGLFRNAKEGVRVREMPDSSSTELDFALTGDVYNLVESSSEGWHKIQIEDQEGWISGKFSEVVE